MRPTCWFRYGWIYLFLLLGASSAAAPVGGERQPTVEIQLVGAEVHFLVLNQASLSLLCVDSRTWFAPGPAFSARNRDGECLTVGRWARNGWHSPSIFASQALSIPAPTRQLLPGEVVDIPFNLETALTSCFWRDGEEGLNRLQRETSEVKIRWGVYVNEGCTQFVRAETDWLPFHFRSSTS